MAFTYCSLFCYLMTVMALTRARSWPSWRGSPWSASETSVWRTAAQHTWAGSLWLFSAKWMEWVITWSYHLTWSICMHMLGIGQHFHDLHIWCYVAYILICFLQHVMGSDIAELLHCQETARLRQEDETTVYDLVDMTSDQSQGLRRLIVWRLFCIPQNLMTLVPWNT